MLLLKFILLEYVEGLGGGRVGDEPNSRQGHVPVERSNNAGANPSSSSSLL